jgi:hypothetical protein
MEEKVKQAFILSFVAALAMTMASAQSPKAAEYWVDWDFSAKKCIIVNEKPTNPNMHDNGPFKTRAEAENAIKNKIMGC